MNHKLWTTLWISVLLAGVHAHAQPLLQPSGFSWNATLHAPADAPLIRVNLPAAGLAALQNRSLDDIRVFDADGTTLPHAVIAKESAPRTETQGPPVRAMQMGSTQNATDKALVANVEVRADNQRGTQSMQLRWEPPAASGEPMQSALFDLRDTQGMVSALDVDVALPQNTPLHLQASVSRTLQQWQVVSNQGPLYAFEGPGAPRNSQLRLSSPTSMKGNFLLLQWSALPGVVLRSVRVRTVDDRPGDDWLVLELPQDPATQDSKRLQWTLPVGASVHAMQWSVNQPNQLHTLSLQGQRSANPDRKRPAAWEPLGTVVVYEVLQNGEVRRNPPHVLPPGEWRALRLTEWPGGGAPKIAGLQSTLWVQPVTLAVLTNGKAPYTLAVGRADTPPGAVPQASLALAAASPASTWPLATLTELPKPPSEPGSGQRWRSVLTSFDKGNALLWAVLIAAAAVLGAVALQLLRSSKAPQDNAPKQD
jgi:hypothetical protein